jgi:hypothetical protein
MYGFRLVSDPRPKQSSGDSLRQPLVFLRVVIAWSIDEETLVPFGISECPEETHV